MPFGFAEGFHWEALVTGSASILLAWGLLRNSWTGSAGQRYVAWLSRVARRMGLNPKDVCREAVKFDLVRIVFGVLVFFRYVPQLQQAWATDNASQITASGGALFLSAALACGLATPVAALCLALLVNPVIDTYLANPGIGALVISMTAFGLALLPAGTTLSLDAWLLRQGRAGAPIRLIYSGWGAASIERAQVARLLPLLAYAAISLASALQHLHEPEWRAGEMVGLLMLLPLMSSSHEAFGWFSQRAPDAYRALSVIATYGMLAWQLLMIPLLLASRHTRLLAIFWGIPFFIASEHLLNIKALGVFAYVLWALIFIDIPGRVAQSSATVFFDDRCNLCDRTVRTISFIDVFRTIEFAPLSKSIERMRAHGMTEDQAQTDMIGVFEGGKLHQGYDLYLALSTRVLFLTPFWPLLKLGALTRIGPAIYRNIADRRRRLFGVCEMSKYRARQPSLPTAAYGEGRQLAPALAISFSLLLACFLVQVPAATSWLSPARVPETLTHFLGPAPLVYGMSKIEVFDQYDLEIYKHFVPLSVKEGDGTLAPAVLFPQDETTLSALTTAHRVISRQPIYCGARLVKDAIQRLPEGHPYRSRTLHADFYVIGLPDRGTDAAPGNVFRLVCSVEGRLEPDGKVSAEITLSDLGVQLARSLLDVPGIDGAWLTAIEDFPCAAEGRRAAYWVGLEADRLSQTDLDSISYFTSRVHVWEPMACMRSFANLLNQVPAYAMASALPANAQGCAMDSSIAAILVSTPLMADRREAGRRSVAAAAAGDFEECARQSAGVRRAYLERTIWQKHTRTPSES